MVLYLKLRKRSKYDTNEAFDIDGGLGGLAKKVNDFIDVGRTATGYAHVAFVEKVEIHPAVNTALLFYSDCDPR